MALEIYNVGLDALADWETATFEWVLLTAGTFDRTHSVVADVLGSATEATVTGYSRPAVATKLRTVDDAEDRITYSCDDPSFGTLDPGETVTAIALIRVVTDDTDSIPVGWSNITPTATDIFDPFVINVTEGVVAYTDQAA
jgi:hypothetical protein